MTTNIDTETGLIYRVFFYAAYVNEILLLLPIKQRVELSYYILCRTIVENLYNEISRNSKCSLVRKYVSKRGDSNEED